MNYKEFYERYFGKSLPTIGLCNCIASGSDRLLIKPTSEDLIDLEEEGFCPVYWGSGVPDRGHATNTEMYGFTPLRQTLVLLLAAYYDQL